MIALNAAVYSLTFIVGTQVRLLQRSPASSKFIGDGIIKSSLIASIGTVPLLSSSAPSVVSALVSQSNAPLWQSSFSAVLTAPSFAAALPLVALSLS
jgi:hypothetical protein